MSDPVCSILNLMLSVEKLWWDNVAQPNNELLISKNDYDARIDELKVAKSGVIWNLTGVTRTHHWSANMYIGATTYQDFGNKRLLRLTDCIKQVLDNNMIIPVYEYVDDEQTDNIVNRLVLTGPLKWLDIYPESNGFKTSMFVATVKYAQSGYL